MIININYCIIATKDKNLILSYARDTECNMYSSCWINFYGLDSKQLFNLFSKHSTLVETTTLCHIVYIAREVYKAELSLIFSQRYYQS